MYGIVKNLELTVHMPRMGGCSVQTLPHPLIWASYIQLGWVMSSNNDYLCVYQYSFAFSDSKKNAYINEMYNYIGN